MLFNSFPFLFGFLPVTLALFFLIGSQSRRLACLWLVVASIFFYGWWSFDFVGLLLVSAIFNYTAGYLISREIQKPSNRARVLLTFAISANLLLLAYFKYAGFFAGMANGLFGSTLNVGPIILPLGISFFTFTQIAFLIDTFKGKAREYDFMHYLLFVAYFPHLIAGPILHHRQIMPQFAERRIYCIDWTNVAAGLTIFVIGLAKKVLCADSLSTIATPIFAAAQSGAQLPLIEAWMGALAYTLQLYFDFSGYCDMAIGLSLFFNVKLPLNFNSPYKAENIIEFWRRWHMTLSAFLRDYLYIPLGGNRKGARRRYFNLFATMALGGLWHGAGWTFVGWGALHGFYLMINHGFHAVYARMGWRRGRFGWAGRLAAGATTFFAVVVGWVLFRAESFAAASNMLLGMMGSFGLSDRGAIFGAGAGLGNERAGALMIAVGLAAVWLLPNTQEFMRGFSPAIEKVVSPQGWTARLVWQPVRWWAWSCFGILLALSIALMSPVHVSEFLYYQF